MNKKILPLLALLTAFLTGFATTAMADGHQMSQGLSKMAIQQTVNINTADSAALSTALMGVGPAKAAAIVAYRKAHGPFKAAGDITAVKGIGQRTLAENRSRIRVH